MSKRLKKIIVIFSTLCLLFITAAVPIFATSTDTTSHRPTYPLAPYEGNMTINLSNDFGVNREDVYTLTFDSNSNIPLPSIDKDNSETFKPTVSNNVLSTKQSLQVETPYYTLYQYLRYIPTNKSTYSSLGGNAFMVNEFTADDKLKTFLAMNNNSSTSISFHIDDLYIPYKGVRPNLYYLPSVTLNLGGLTASGFTAPRYVYYSFSAYDYDVEGNLTVKALTYTVLCNPSDDGTLTFPLIPYAHSVPSTQGSASYMISPDDTSSYYVGINPIVPDFDNGIPLYDVATPVGNIMHIGNLNATVLVPPQQKQYLDDGDLSIEYSSVYYTPVSGSATNSKQNTLSTSYQQSLMQRYGLPSDTNWFDWIVDSLSAFLNIHLVGNLTLGTIFGLVFSVPLLIVVLRSFDGG